MNKIVAIYMLCIGLVVGSIFLFLHFYFRKRTRKYFSHDQKSETILGHLRKYYLFSVASLFYIFAVTGFFTLILNN